jgi:hypothetical protein
VQPFFSIPQFPVEQLSEERSRYELIDELNEENNFLLSAELQLGQIIFSLFVDDL